MAIKADKTYLGLGVDFIKTPYTTASSIDACITDIKEENIVRIISDGIIGDYEISAKLIGQKTWTPIFVGTGNVDTTLDISLYDSIRVATLTAIVIGTLAISAFLVPGATTMTPTGGDATAVNQVSGNATLSSILNELQINPELEFASSPTIINIDVQAVGTTYDSALPEGTKRFLIRHRNQGSLEFSFQSTLSSHITIPKGGSYKETDLSLFGAIIYFRTSKVGSVEIIAWT